MRNGTSRAFELFSRIEKGGESAILDFVADRQSEELFLDFKRSADNGGGRRLHDNDRNNLSKAISGFGNSEGGVVIWGIDCTRDADGADVARARVPIHNVRRFVSWLEGAVSGCTVPPHQGVRSIAIQTEDKEDGYAITLIPKSNHAPHQVVGRLQYFIRAGSDFVPTPHAVLAGMFGRVPQPHVFHSYIVPAPTLQGSVIKAGFGIALHNDGPGIASDLFLNVLMVSHPGSGSQIKFEPQDSENWTGVWAFSREVNLICKPTYRLPPDGKVQPLIMDLRLSPPFEHDLTLKVMAGAGGSPPYRFTLHQTASELTRAYNEYINLDAKGEMSEERSRALQKILMGHTDAQSESLPKVK